MASVINQRVSANNDLSFLFAGDHYRAKDFIRRFSGHRRC